MSKSMFLMCKDTPVLEVNLSDVKFVILCDDLVPFTLKNRIKAQPVFTDNTPVDKIVKLMTDFGISNNDLITSWLGHRSLPLSRKNAKKLYNALRLSQQQDIVSRAKVSLECHAVSLQDDYWVKLQDDTTKWCDIDLRTNKLNESMAQIALHGSGVSIQGSITSPELTSQGAYAKAWHRDPDGLYLYKAGDVESRIEVMVSNLLDKTNATHLKYEEAYSDGRYCCRCKCMSTDKLSILPGSEFDTYCNVVKKNPDIEILKIDADSMYKMWIVDYLIANSDRHGFNWGLFYDSHTMEILRCHPLYDHNNAFDDDWMDNPDSSYQFGNMSIREAAHRGKKRCDFKITGNITRKDFMSALQYEVFTDRAKELGYL